MFYLHKLTYIHIYMCDYNIMYILIDMWTYNVYG